MATTIRWIDNSSVETGHRIYKSATHFTKDNLPDVLVELGPDVSEYEDVDGADGENWYIVSAFLNDYEVFSEPFIAGLTTVYSHDIFGDGSAVATYNFDGDATDIGKKHNFTNTSNVTWINDELISGSAEVRGGIINETFSTDSDYVTVSAWIKVNNIVSNLTSLISVPYNGGAMEIGCDGSSIGVANPITGRSSLIEFGNIKATEWFHVCAVYGEHEGTVFYLNNRFLDQRSSRNFYGESKGLYIGIRTNNTNTTPIDMNIDQLRIFNRALTREEVDILYLEGSHYL